MFTSQLPLSPPRQWAASGSRQSALASSEATPKACEAIDDRASGSSHLSGQTSRKRARASGSSAALAPAMSKTETSTGRRRRKVRSSMDRPSLESSRRRSWSSQNVDSTLPAPSSPSGLRAPTVSNASMGGSGSTAALSRLSLGFRAARAAEVSSALPAPPPAPAGPAPKVDSALKMAAPPAPAPIAGDGVRHRSASLRRAAGAAS
mmetsp:Transcript_82310/g.230913  ORF Transcript_82310/g.230913 Transcript_82310/m.230913 type:complete len:206 (+) Transcript_82310:207-824(+)